MSTVVLSPYLGVLLVWCPGLASVTMINNMTKSILWKKGFFWLMVVVSHEGKSGQEPRARIWRQELKHAQGGTTHSGLDPPTSILIKKLPPPSLPAGQSD